MVSALMLRATLVPKIRRPTNKFCAPSATNHVTVPVSLHQTTTVSMVVSLTGPHHKHLLPPPSRSHRPHRPLMEPPHPPSQAPTTPHGAPAGSQSVAPPAITPPSTAVRMDGCPTAHALLKGTARTVCLNAMSHATAPVITAARTVSSARVPALHLPRPKPFPPRLQW